jgi:hypothetical protein
MMDKSDSLSMDAGLGDGYGIHLSFSPGDLLQRFIMSYL